MTAADAAEGDLKTTVLGGKSDKPAVPVGVSTASHNVEGEMEPGEFRKLQSMLGGAKAKDSHTFVGQRGVTITVTEGVDPRATLVFANCHDCAYTVNTLCTKVFIQACTNFRIVFNAKIVTNMVEVFKGESVHCTFNTKCGTLQMDMCRDLKLHFARRDLFHDVVWAGCHGLQVRFEDSGEQLDTGFHEMAEDYADLVEERSQFKLHYLNGKLINEKIIRLDNGFPTTLREKEIFDQRQELAMKALAKEWGITIPKKQKDEPKVGRNDPCPCGSGRKHKKCCGSAV